jgi:glucosamine--fructose-6-phosphate aminotransferase (isomerizing)
MPILGLVPRDSVYEKSISNIEEIRARHGQLILIGSEGDRNLKTITDHVLFMPQPQTMVAELNPILFTIPAQLLAYEIATRRGCDVDQPRNLAKSVTVE